MSNEIQEWLTPERVAEGWEAFDEGIRLVIGQKQRCIAVSPVYDYWLKITSYEVELDSINDSFLSREYPTFTEAADSAERLYKFLKEEGYCG